jgi:murein DD-endopeptidase MepM/ murein hydrolase activator NlpD
MRLSYPWPEGYTVNKNSPYGYRTDPITRKRKFHHGIDVALPVGTPLTAPADGEIVHKGSGAEGGNTLIVQHAPDVFTVYYHLQKPSHFAKGAKVSRGDIIAYSGNTGRSTGPHLHFEVRKSRRWGNTVDPMPFFSKADNPQPLVTDGILGKNTWSAVSRMLIAKGYYKGAITNRPDKTLVRSLQTFLNEGGW